MQGAAGLAAVEENEHVGGGALELGLQEGPAEAGDKFADAFWLPTEGHQVLVANLNFKEALTHKQTKSSCHTRTDDHVLSNIL